MNERAWEVFFDLHRDLLRQGPGDASSTRRAWALLRGLPPHPRVLDVGCGPGMQTMVLAGLTDGDIVAVDTHQPFLDTLAEHAQHAGCADRVHAVSADMNALPFEYASFDVVWAEGSIYVMGFDQGLRAWRRLLRDGGYLAVTELTWLVPDPPLEASAFFAEAYPAMRDVPDNLTAIRASGYEAVDHFVLPAAAWWDDYYTPLEQRLVAARSAYAGDDEALAIIEAEQLEIDCYRTFGDSYGYVFFVARAA